MVTLMIEMEMPPLPGTRLRQGAAQHTWAWARMGMGSHGHVDAWAWARMGMGLGMGTHRHVHAWAWAAP